MSVPSGMSSNPVEVLGLDRSATFEDVQLAYRRPSLAGQHAFVVRAVGSQPGNRQEG